MNQINLKIKKLRPDAVVPTYGTLGSAGADLYACHSDECINSFSEVFYHLLPGSTKFVALGFAMELPSGYEAQIRSRSGLALRKGLIVLNAPGTVDEDYRGEMMVIVHNTSQEIQIIKCGERIAQMVIAPVTKAQFEVVDELSSTSRGAGGFGSTGSK